MIKKCECCKNEFTIRKQYPTQRFCSEKCKSKMWWQNNKDRAKMYSSIRIVRQKKKVVEFLGGKCIECGNTDWRVLQVNHINGNGSKELKKLGGGGSKKLYRMILSKRRKIDDLDLRCANCNIIYEFEQGRRGKGLKYLSSDGASLTTPLTLEVGNNVY